MRKFTEANRAKARQWKRDNPEKVIAMRKAYYLKNRDLEKARAVRWQKQNPLRTRKIAKDSYERHRRAVIEKMRLYSIGKLNRSTVYTASYRAGVELGLVVEQKFPDRKTRYDHHRAFHTSLVELGILKKELLV